MKKQVFIVGNPILTQDNLPVKILPDLIKKFPEIQFIPIDPTEEFPFNSIKKLILIDTVIGITRVRRIDDLEDFSISPRVTVHDFDLPVSLGLMKKLGKIRSVTVIGVPPRGDKKNITRQVTVLLRACLISSRHSGANPARPEKR